MFKAFENWMHAQDVADDRQALALLRIVEPLAEAAESAFCEPGAADFDVRSLRAFVRAGILRERLILSARPPR
jgi:hypothetical protein